VLIKWNGKQWGGADVPDMAGPGSEVINPSS
jgi:formate dehydrogenase major subunit